MEVSEFDIGNLDLTPHEKDVVRKLLRQGYTIQNPLDLPSCARCPKCRQKTETSFALCWKCKDYMVDADNFP